MHINARMFHEKMYMYTDTGCTKSEVRDEMVLL